MTTLSMTDRHSGAPRPQPGFISYLRNKWEEHRLMRTIESVPFDVMKDVGFPGAERAHEL